MIRTMSSSSACWTLNRMKRGRLALRVVSERPIKKTNPLKGEAWAGWVHRRPAMWVLEGEACDGQGTRPALTLTRADAR